MVLEGIIVGIINVVVEGDMVVTAEVVIVVKEEEGDMVVMVEVEDWVVEVVEGDMEIMLMEEMEDGAEPEVVEGDILLVEDLLDVFMVLNVAGVAEVDMDGADQVVEIQHKVVTVVMEVVEVVEDYMQH